MPGVSSVGALAYYYASDLPQDFWGSLMQNEPAANIILPFARKALDFTGEESNDQLWIILRDETGSVEFVLSCTRGVMGNYPIFIFTPKSSPFLAREEKLGRNIADSMEQLVLCLLREVPGGPKRIFSVFAIAKVAEKFAQKFEQLAPREYGIQAREPPYYDATFTYCTRETLNSASTSFSSLSDAEDIIIALCPANASHLEGVKILCKGFSELSPPYGLDDERAELEAKTLINNREVWVHLIQQDGREEIACIVAATRTSDNVTAITKLFTAEHWRGRGCAGRLLHRVCKEILEDKPFVVLYVGNGEASESARKLYHKVGFQGLGEGQEQVTEGVERWLEIGFDNTTLGYW